MGVFTSIRNKFEKASNIIDHHHEQGITFSLTSPNLATIDERVIYRNRYNCGVNLGSLFVLEKWIYDSLFTEASGAETEFDAVLRCMRSKGAGETSRLLLSHYMAYLDKIDWEWLRSAGGRGVATALRVPIGYWHVNNGEFLSGGLPFEPLREVYKGCKPWDILKQLIQKAKEFHIGVLIDIHGLPGGANGEGHSGMRNGRPVFFENAKFVSKMTDEIIPFIVQDICIPNVNVIGLQLVNEAAFSEHAEGQKAYYLKAISAVNRLDPNLPVVISDGWWPDQWADWVSQNGLDTIVVIDSHVYRCFSDKDKSKNADQIIHDLPQEIQFPRDKADFVVGEFSCVLDQQTWNRTPSGPREHYVQQYGLVQTSTFNQVASWGWFFWTLQFKYGDGGEWGFVPMTNGGNLKWPDRNIGTEIPETDITRIINEHIDYWRDKGGDNFEHWRYEDGLRSGVRDIQEFRKFDGSCLGRWHTWFTLRRNEYLREKGDSQYMWEWDQGYQRAISEFNRLG